MRPFVLLGISCLAGWYAIACTATGFWRDALIAVLVCLAAFSAAVFLPHHHHHRSVWEEAERILREADR